MKPVYAAVLVLFAGCTHAQLVTAEQAAATCASAAVAAEVANLKGAVVAILSNPAITDTEAQAQLNALKPLGEQALVCLISNEAGALVSSGVLQFQAAPIGPAQALAHSRALAFLKAEALSP